MTRERSSPKRPTVRCAVYTRKSSEEGLDQDFNSLDAQRESGQAYIKSQAALGWVWVSEPQARVRSGPDRAVGCSKRVPG
jgi:site-specific DNA recombinase